MTSNRKDEAVRIERFMTDQQLFQFGIKALKDARNHIKQECSEQADHSLSVAQECVAEIIQRREGKTNGKEDV